jgi:hypothetical protein
LQKLNDERVYRIVSPQTRKGKAGRTAACPVYDAINSAHLASDPVRSGTLDLTLRDYIVGIELSDQRVLDLTNVCASSASEFLA